MSPEPEASRADICAVAIAEAFTALGLSGG